MQLPGPNPQFPRHFVRHDGYQVQYLPQNGKEGKLEAFYFVVKRSYDLEPGKARPALMQRPLHTADKYFEAGLDPLRSPMRYETDLMPPKVACDVIVNGHCYAPGGEAVQAVCSVQVGDNAPKRVRVIGDRSAWQPRNARGDMRRVHDGPKRAPHVRRRHSGIWSLRGSCMSTRTLQWMLGEWTRRTRTCWSGRCDFS